MGRRLKMMIGLPILKPYVNSYFYKMNKFDYTMIRKNPQMSCKQGGILIKIFLFIVPSLVGIVIHCATINWNVPAMCHRNVSIHLNKNFQLRGNFKGGK